MARGRGVIDLGLQRVRSALGALGSPERSLQGRVVHVGGTNGKGSVCAYIAAALRADGHRVGVFTSPHLVRAAAAAAIAAAAAARASAPAAAATDRGVLSTCGRST